ncbi:hypothetical protein [Streptomyces sp. NPDC002855]|uniref:hypothetical protein n=1 Tax=Streptomyces sp. NPDC002855 TaxID=3154437 RepID=UPI0033245D6D
MPRRAAAHRLRHAVPVCSTDVTYAPGGPSLVKGDESIVRNAIAQLTAAKLP